ncbi:hypothetical protein BH09SUM1_BH09SUM1_19520 [soil metagenome]
MKTDNRTLATCLEHEWADLLFPERCISAADFLRDPTRGRGRFIPSPFYAAAADYARMCFAAEHATFRRVIEIGGATGRFCHEWLGGATIPTHYTLSDPAPEKIDLAEWLLADGGPREIPVNSSQLRVTRETVTPPAGARIPAIHQLDFAIRTAEDPAWQNPAADFLVCLNVTDHTADPTQFIESLRRLLRPGGYALIASPLDWMSDYTPPALWKDDMAQLFGGGWSLMAQTDLPFYHRSRPRRLIVFSSQLIIAQRIGS